MVGKQSDWYGIFSYRLLLCFETVEVYDTSEGGESQP